VIHDIFDTLDSTGLLFKPVVNRHVNCQVMMNMMMVMMMMMMIIIIIIMIMMKLTWTHPG
jgi:hypothetical protein